MIVTSVIASHLFLTERTWLKYRSGIVFSFMTLIKERTEIPQDAGSLVIFCYVLIPFCMLEDDLLSDDLLWKKKESLNNHATCPLLNISLYSLLVCPTFILPYTDTLF